jgi:hypothetical protein
MNCLSVNNAKFYDLLTLNLLVNPNFCVNTHVSPTRSLYKKAKRYKIYFHNQVALSSFEDKVAFFVAKFRRVRLRYRVQGTLNATLKNIANKVIRLK